MLDALGNRYGVLPSTIMGITGRAFMFNLKVMGKALEASKEAGTLAGQIRQTRMGWPPEIKQELREKGLWR